MLGPADLVISAGHALRVRCTQAKDGSINVVISHQVESGGIDTLGLREDSPWQFSECKKADTHKIAFQFNTVGNSDIAGDIQRTALRQKIATKWEKTTGLLHQNVELWSKNPSAFFGADRFNTSEEWSYQSLRNSTSKLSSVFHKINLANCDDERIQRVKTHSPNFDMRQLRKSTLNSLHPGYGELGDQERNTIRKNFAEDISNGIVLRSLNERSWGLLLTIGPILSDRDLAFLSKHKATSWLCKEKLDTSKKFAKLALILLSYLEHKLTNFGYDPPISPTPTFILPLLHAMGGCVPTSLFDGTSSPRRMDEQGAWYEVPLSNSGLGQGIVKHLDINVLTSNLESLVAVSMITVHDSSYIYGDQPAWISSEQFRGYWINQAFRFCCYVFPRGPILDSFSVSTGKKLLHILSYILQIYTEIGQEPPHCEDTVETLFAASRLAEPDAKEHLLAMATKSEKCISRVYLQADVTPGIGVGTGNTGLSTTPELKSRKFAHIASTTTYFACLQSNLQVRFLYGTRVAKLGPSEMFSVGWRECCSMRSAMLHCSGIKRAGPVRGSKSLLQNVSYFG
ncbi:hypothetical protein EJ07DRAFT_158546 [Lizonia empirigonia]|nr:hypothetical protein EJ07DRAFT_158546 [Lizonia empirigonia]